MEFFFSFNETVDLDFLDLQRSSLSSAIPSILLKVANLSLLVVVGYSLYFLCRKTPKRIWLFVLTLTGITAFTLLLPDLALGGFRSLVPRYLIPSYLGIQLAMAYLLTTKSTDISAGVWQQKLWHLIAIALVSVGVFSCAIDAQAEVTWSKELGKTTPR